MQIDEYCFMHKSWTCQSKFQKLNFQIVFLRLVVLLTPEEKVKVLSEECQKPYIYFCKNVLNNVKRKSNLFLLCIKLKK